MALGRRRGTPRGAARRGRLAVEPGRALGRPRAERGGEDHPAQPGGGLLPSLRGDRRGAGGEARRRSTCGRLRESIGTVEPGLARRIQGRYTGFEVVLTGATGSIALLHDRITDEHRARAARLMGEIGVEEALRDRKFEDCSQGERQRLLLARSLMDEPDLLLLDEPTTGLDLPSRERLIASLDAMAEANADLPTVLVTHHLEEIPATTTHALLLRDGAIVSAGADRRSPHQRRRLDHLRHRGRGRPQHRPLGRDGRPQLESPPPAERPPQRAPHPPARARSSAG